MKALSADSSSSASLTLLAGVGIRAWRTLFGLVTALVAVPCVAEESLPTPVAPDVWRVGTIDHFAMTEGSGLAASRRYPGVIWTHNDGGYPFVFAVSETGQYLGAFQVVGANLIDWEAVGIDNDGNLYLADIGSNGLARTHIAVHRVREPNPSDRFGNVPVAQSWWLRFPGMREDCEAFFVVGPHGYLITKPRASDGRVTLLRFPLTRGSGSTLLEVVTRFPVRAAVTDASISADGSRLAVLTGEGAYLYQINGDPRAVDLGPSAFTFFENTFMEGGTLVDDGFLVSAETRELWLFTEPMFQCNTPAGFVRPLVDRTVYAGGSVTFDPGPVGCPVPVLQWRRNGQRLPGSTKATLVVSNVTDLDAGAYELVISNRWRQVTTTAELNVQSGPMLRLAGPVPGTTDQLRLEFNALAGFVYELESRDDVDSTPWNPTGMAFAAPADGVGSFDLNRAGAARFYRLRIPAIPVPEF